MMANWTIRIDPAAEAAVRRLGGFANGGALRAIAAALDEQNELTTGHVQQTRLSQRGPQSLGVVTNRLRSSLRPSKAEISGSAVISAIGSNVKYLGVHEFGFNETVTVGSHQRRRASFEGRQISLRDAKGIRGKLRKEKLKLSTVTVRSHQRRMKFPERAPVRRGIEERLPEYGKAISEGLVEAIEK